MSETCVIELSLPILGRIVLPREGSRASRACDASDAMKAGELPFEEYLAEALTAVPAAGEQRAALDAWVATIPLDIIERVRSAVDGCVPHGHRCAGGGPHRRVCLEFIEAPRWGTFRSPSSDPSRAWVVVHGPAPSAAP